MDVIKSAFSTKERNSDVMNSFGFRLRNQFSQNKAYRRPKELQWLEDLRTYKGIYDPDVVIDPNNSKVYPKITRSKVNIVLSRLHEMLFPETDKNWEIMPTPEPRVDRDIVTQLAMSLVTENPEQPGVPVIPTEKELRLAIKKYVEEACGKMASVVDDQLTEMDYPEETKKVLRSGLMYGTGIMKGPLVGKRLKRRWEPIAAGEYEEMTTSEDVPDLRAIRIWDWYPDMTVTELESAEGSYERHVMTKHDLRQLLKRSDFYADMITDFLRDHPDGDYVPLNWEVDLQVIEVEAGSGRQRYSGTSVVGAAMDDHSRSTNRQLGKKYEVLEYWGYVDGSDLEACGIPVADVTLEYAANVWVLGSKVIKANLFPGALDQYKIFYYEKDETSIFGEGLCRVMRGSALAIGAAARMVLDNASCCCLTGDTVVYRKHRKPITIQELWDGKLRKKTKIRSMDELTGELFYNSVLGIIDQGVQDVYELQTLNGYKIKATQDHRFIGDDGEWVELRHFEVGDLIAVNGTHNRPTGVCLDCGAVTKGSGVRCRSCAMTLTHPSDTGLPKLCTECGKPTATRGVRCRKCASKLVNSAWNQKQALAAEFNDLASASTARSRWSCQKDKKSFCERCGIKAETGIRLDVHHVDRNPHNNATNNKLTLCATCHRFEHRRHDHMGEPTVHTFVDFDEIVSINFVGPDNVYDIQMAAPNYNFVANGVIAHNCGPQVEINWSLMTPDTDINSIYPRKIWFREGKGIDAQYPALRVYNIDSHIQELLTIVDAFKQFGDEETTLPTWMIGQMVNNETAQATSGRMATITVSIKDVVKNFDAFTEKIMRDIYAWNMEFNPRKDIKGDFNVKARGVSSLVMKEIRMQALTQLTTTLTPEEWAYVPKREFLMEKFKAHDILITLLEEEEVAKAQEAQQNSIQMQLAVELQKSEIAKNKAQSLSLLTKAKEHNVSAIKESQTPPEIPPGQDPRLQDAELEGKQTETMGKQAEIRRQEERHAMELAHASETHSVKKAVDTTKAAQDVAIKGQMAAQDMETKAKMTDHDMKMKEHMMKASAEAKKTAAKQKKPAVKTKGVQ